MLYSRKMISAITRALCFAMLLVLACQFLSFPAAHPVYASEPTFASQHIFGNGRDQTQNIAVGDVNGDGSLDLVLARYFEPNVIYFNDGTGAFSPGEALGPPGGDVRGVALGDMNDDGSLDIVVGTYQGQSAVYVN